MSLFRLLMLLRQINIAALLSVPNFLDAAATRVWLLDICKAGDVFADMTDTGADDAVLSAMRQVLDQPDAWTAMHGLLVDLLVADEPVAMQCAGDSDDHEGMAALVAQQASPAQIQALATRVGLSPAVILMIVQAAIALLRMFRELREARG